MVENTVIIKTMTPKVIETMTPKVIETMTPKVIETMTSKEHTNLTNQINKPHMVKGRTLCPCQ